MSKKLNLAVIGTNFIVPKFIDAAERSGYFRLHAVLSRKVASGVDFRESNNYKADVIVYDSIDALLGDDQVDVVYVASPNAIHFSQASACITAAKAVIVEKPMTSNSKELASLIALAKNSNVLLLDGMKSLFCPNFNVLLENLPRVGRIRQCTTTYSKVSSRYQDYLLGNNPNTFNPLLSNGSMMDLGVYCLYPFVQLFGVPAKVHAFADLLESGVDGAGVVVLKYADFHVAITHSKVCGSANSSEIQGELGTIIIGNISTFDRLQFVDKAGAVTDLSIEQDSNDMLYIAEHLGELLLEGRMESPVNTHELSLKTMKILDEIRVQTGVRYPADSA